MKRIVFALCLAFITNLSAQTAQVQFLNQINAFHAHHMGGIVVFINNVAIEDTIWFGVSNMCESIIPANDSVVIRVEGGSKNLIGEKTVYLHADSSYIAVMNGSVLIPYPSRGFSLDIIGIPSKSSISNHTGLAFYSGVLDVDSISLSVTTDNISYTPINPIIDYGSFSPYIEVATDDYILRAEYRRYGYSKYHYFNLPLQTMGLADSSIILLSEGHLFDISVGSRSSPYKGYSHIYIASNCEKFELDNMIGMNENLELGIDIYPNPSNGSFLINFADVLHEPVEITVIDNKGSLVYNSSIDPEDLKGDIPLDLRHFSPGLYNLNLKIASGKIYSYKLLIQ